MKNFVSAGDIIAVTAPYDVTAGAGCLVGTLFGIAATTVASGEKVNLNTKGVFDIAKVSAQAWTVGAAVYWDDSAKNFTTTSSSNTLVAKAVAIAANPSSIGRVRLNG